MQAAAAENLIQMTSSFYLVTFLASFPAHLLLPPPSPLPQTPTHSSYTSSLIVFPAHLAFLFITPPLVLYCLTSPRLYPPQGHFSLLSLTHTSRLSANVCVCAATEKSAELRPVPRLLLHSFGSSVDQISSLRPVGPWLPPPRGNTSTDNQ